MRLVNVVDIPFLLISYIVQYLIGSE